MSNGTPRWKSSLKISDADAVYNFDTIDVDGKPEVAFMCLKRMVGERGFEPPTPWSRTRCSTRLSHSPTYERRSGNDFASAAKTTEEPYDYIIRSPSFPGREVRSVASVPVYFVGADQPGKCPRNGANEPSFSSAEFRHDTVIPRIV